MSTYSVPRLTFQPSQNQIFAAVEKWKENGGCEGKKGFYCDWLQCCKY